jgi:hypothetical protein
MHIRSTDVARRRTLLRPDGQSSASVAALSSRSNCEISVYAAC